MRECRAWGRRRVIQGESEHDGLWAQENRLSAEAQPALASAESPVPNSTQYLKSAQ